MAIYSVRLDIFLKLIDTEHSFAHKCTQRDVPQAGEKQLFYALMKQYIIIIYFVLQ